MEILLKLPIRSRKTLIFAVLVIIGTAVGLLFLRQSKADVVFGKGN
jgi:hypothetical protein